ncbi:CDP-alcohol phosphatidyltransferase family protein [Methanofollis fontis]|uniref:CDP-alcohol phosphatidyltransferase n=1 Tax=Methanofollis fontis TaxID=2052832 RepID=A0A483CTB2_9EURY|nr:CDP-alcohol phosphatidyltransferase family protein [Methanofollis fontis]TAJ44488.1 CDP-alcohol phosphatidyltransferase [Methanofollis fontis]
MNITALRPRLISKLEPIADFFIRAGFSPNQISYLSLLFGVFCAVSFAYRLFLPGAVLLLISAILDLVDGTVARKKCCQTKFGAVIDWVFDKYVDALALLGVGLSGIAIVSGFTPLPPAADWAVVAIAIFGSMMNTFIKPVVYAEVGFSDRVGGKIHDPLEGIGFFGRPETLIALIIGSAIGYAWVAVIIIAVCTNLSAIQRIIYLSGSLS